MLGELLMALLNQGRDGALALKIQGTLSDFLASAAADLG